MSSSISTSEWRARGLRALGALAAALVLLTAAELVLRGLPIARGVHPQDPPTPEASTRLAPNRSYTWSIGWDLRNPVRGRTNAMGFLSPREYRKDRRAIALFGDSFAEAQMLEYEESLAGQLEAHFPDLEVFNFGLSGAALPHYLGMAREVSAFRFEAAVVIVTPADYAEGFEVKPGYYRWSDNPEKDLVRLVPAASADSTRQLLRSLALVRYVRANLKFSPASLLETSRQQGPCVPAQLKASDQMRVSRYVDELPHALGLPPEKIVLMFHTHISGIYERVDHKRSPTRAGEGCPGVDDLALGELRRLAAARGMKLMDATAVLEDHYRAHRRPLGFEPVDSHWNARATDAIARELAQLLGARGRTEPKPPTRMLLSWQ